MLSNNLRLRLQKITNKIENNESVSLEEITFAQKLADHNHSAAEILKRARRKSVQGDVEDGSLDELLQDMNLGEPDPENHLTGESSIDDIIQWFRRDNTDDWRQRD